MRSPLFPIVLLTSTGLASAQSVSITATPVTDYAVVTQIGGVTTSSVLPAGVPAPIAQVVTGQYLVAEASSQWQSSSSEIGTWYDSQIITMVSGISPGASASKAPSDVMIELQSATPVEVDLTVTHSLYQTGSATLTWRVDIGDDGSVEFDELLSPPFGPTLGPFTVGPQPLRIRITTALDRTQPGSTTFFHRITATPHNDLVIAPAMPGCSDDVMTLQQSFLGEGLTWRANTQHNPIIAVIGLSLQPLFLSPAFPTPCLLLPNADYLVYLPPFQNWTLPLPPAVRPLTFWTQGVAITPQGLSVTDAAQVAAQ